MSYYPKAYVQITLLSQSLLPGCLYYCLLICNPETVFPSASLLEEDEPDIFKRERKQQQKPTVAHSHCSTLLLFRAHLSCICKLIFIMGMCAY